MSRTETPGRTANVCPPTPKGRAETAGDIAKLLARLLAPFVAEELRAARNDDWIAHPRSPLGARRTRELARAGRLPGARKVGRTWMVPRAALNAFVEGAGVVAPTADREADEDDEHAVRALLAEHDLELAPKPTRTRRAP